MNARPLGKHYGLLIGCLTLIAASVALCGIVHRLEWAYPDSPFTGRNGPLAAEAGPFDSPDPANSRLPLKFQATFYAAATACVFGASWFFFAWTLPLASPKSPVPVPVKKIGAASGMTAGLGAGIMAIPVAFLFTWFGMGPVRALDVLIFAAVAVIGAAVIGALGAVLGATVGAAVGLIAGTVPRCAGRRLAGAGRAALAGAILNGITGSLIAACVSPLIGDEPVPGGYKLLFAAVLVVAGLVGGAIAGRYPDKATGTSPEAVRR